MEPAMQKRELGDTRKPRHQYAQPFLAIVGDPTEMVCCFNPEGRLTSVNAEYCRYFGKNPNDLIGQPFEDLMRPQDSQHSKRFFSSLNHRNPVAVTIQRVLLPNGETRWQQWTSRAIFNDKGDITEYRTIGHDLSETLTVEDALKEYKTAYSTLISEMRAGFALSEALCNEKGEPHDFILLRVNPAFEKITGLHREALIGKTVREVLPGDADLWVESWAHGSLSNTPFHFKSIARLKIGYFEVITYSPQTGQLVVILTDISKRVHAELALRESKNNFRSITENAKDGIIIVGRNGRLEYANRSFSEVSGYRNRELLKLKITDLVYQDDSERLTARLQRMIAAKTIPACYETILITKQGDKVPIEVMDSMMTWSGQPAALSIVRNISVRMQIEGALGKINAELERRVDERTKELVETAEKLKNNQQELIRHKLDLEKANKELVQTNTALSVLARNIDKKRDAVENKIAQTISSQIIPLIEELKTDKIPGKTLAKLDVLSAYLNDLTPGASKSHDIIVSLSSMEIRVAVMIKNGFTSEEIARLLHISPHTVKTHRRSIRRKLRIKNSKINLGSYLKLKFGKVSKEPQLDESLKTVFDFE